ncbi:MAG: hypothetical protein AB7I59_00855 [Geminicoccaceae bacterium]
MSSDRFPRIAAFMLTGAVLVLGASTQPAQATHSADRWAVVNQNGTLARGKGAVSSGYAFAGVLGSYRVVFNKDVSKCAYQATLGTEYPSTPASGEIAVAPDAANVRAVHVATRTSAGVATNRPFHLFVSC